MPVTSEQIRHVAALAHLNLSQFEIVQLTSELSAIVDYIAQLQQVIATSGLPGERAETEKPVGREDIIRPSLAIDEALQNAPQCEGDYFLVPRVIG